jgi:hypothetical protein
LEATPARRRQTFALATLASLACLQPGIDPVYLTLLSLEHQVPATHHGWVVGVTQTGMALGSLAIWRAALRLRDQVFQLAALGALAANALTVMLDHTAALLATRGFFGFAMGIIYTQAMSNAAAIRPNGAYGGVFLLQLLFSTVAALLLPLISQAASPAAALAAMCVVPLVALAVTVLSPMSRVPFWSSTAHRIADGHQLATGRSAWAMAGATLLFICATMMVWTFSGALAAEAGISEGVIGHAVALGSLAGAVTACIVIREKPLVPPILTGVVGGLFLMSPVVGATPGKNNLFILSIILLNIGSTAIIVRTSGLASAASGTPKFRRFVACTHSLGLILGPVAGSVATGLMADQGLFMAAAIAIFGGCFMLVLSELWRSTGGASSWGTGEVNDIPKPRAEARPQAR